MNRITCVALLFSILPIAACSTSSTSSESNEELPAPWDNGESVGTISTEFGDVFVIDAKKGEFFSVIEGICNNFETSVVVTPRSLLDRGVTLRVEGADAQAILSEVAQKTGLDFARSEGDGFTLTLPGAEGGDSETVTMSPY